jgi:hypothetical protein
VRLAPQQRIDVHIDALPPLALQRGVSAVDPPGDFEESSSVAHRMPLTITQALPFADLAFRSSSVRLVFSVTSNCASR